MSDLTDMKKALLAEWEQKRDEYAALAKALRRELGMTDNATLDAESTVQPPSTATGSLDVNQLVTPGDFFGMTQVDAIQQFLQRTNRRTATLQEMAQALFRGKATETLLEGDKLKNLSSLLSKTEVFFPVARGRWGLAEWYPGKQKSKRTKDAAPVQQSGKSENEKASV